MRFASSCGYQPYIAHPDGPKGTFHVPTRGHAQSYTLTIANSGIGQASTLRIPDDMLAYLPTWVVNRMG